MPKNPYTKQLKKQITINVDADAIDYFKKQSEKKQAPWPVGGFIY